MGEDTKELTDKQKLSLVLIGAAKSVHAGVMECVRQKIVSRDWFYRHWLKNPAYVEATNAERDRHRPLLSWYNYTSECPLILDLMLSYSC